MAEPNNNAISLLSEVFEESSERLGKALVELDYPNGAKRNSILHENNLIIHFAHALMKRGFECYAEAAVERGKVDLIAGGRKLAIAIEAKMFGDPRHRVPEIEGDLNRMQHFSPACRSSKSPDWWSASQERWGVIVVGHQRAGSNVIERAWMTPDDAEAARLIEQGNAGRHWKSTVKEITASFVNLKQLLRARGAKFDAKKICDDAQWKDCDGAWLLWAALRL